MSLGDCKLRQQGKARRHWWEWPEARTPAASNTGKAQRQWEHTKVGLTKLSTVPLQRATLPFGVYPEQLKHFVCTKTGARKSLVISVIIAQICSH